MSNVPAGLAVFLTGKFRTAGMEKSTAAGINQRNTISRHTKRIIHKNDRNQANPCNWGRPEKRAIEPSKRRASTAPKFG
jgi:hypothetical protein